MIPVEVSDYYERVVALLLTQFKDKANFQAFVRVLTVEVQEIEGVGFQLFLLRQLETAEGAQLDALGDVFGASRNGASDTNYRAAIRLRIYEISGSGVVDELLIVLKAVTAAANVGWWNNYPASIALLTDGESIPSSLFQGMLALAPAAVALWIYVTYGTPLPLGFDSEDPEGVIEMEGGGVSLDGGYILAYQPIPPNTNTQAGTFCDVDEENTIITYENSGRFIDVLQEA